ncbi:MAG: DUF1656 domain-containing protein [Luteibacter sp.]
MSSEWDIGGVLLHGALVTALIAGALHLGLRWLLGRTRAYAWMWHPGLADVALFVMVWAGVAALLPRSPF